MADGIVFRVEGLHYDLASFRTAACPAGHLRQELECPLTGTEVGEMQGSICKEDTDQCYVRKVQALCDHLRPDKYVCLLILHALKDAHMGASLGSCIPVHPDYPCIRKEFLQIFLDPLSAGAECLPPASAALRTGIRRFNNIIAVMATEVAVSFMIS